MTIPAAMFIEMATDSLKHVAPEVLVAQSKELRETKFDSSADFISGYQLGLQTARMILLGVPAVRKAGINPEDLL